MLITTIALAAIALATPAQAERSFATQSMTERAGLSAEEKTAWAKFAISKSLSPRHRNEAELDDYAQAIHHCLDGYANAGSDGSAAGKSSLPQTLAVTTAYCSQLVELPIYGGR